jgi:hypothetical protein
VGIITEKVDEAVLALLYSTLHDGARAEEFRLGQPEPAASQRLDLKPRQ